jgi:iron(II)-dependent oxidoreductase
MILPLPSEQHNSPRRERDHRLWAALLGRDPRQRAQAARTILALEQEHEYTRDLLSVVDELQPRQRARAGAALSLLGDPRFSPPHYLPEMIHVPGGVAVLGSSAVPDERPIHRIEVGGFTLGQFPVINAAYAVFVAATGHRAPRGWRRRQPDATLLNAPVVWVSARDAEAYCLWLSAETGHTFRLPTEAEWVLAARGAGEPCTYPWGDAYLPGCANLWEGDPIRGVCAVGLFPQGRGPYGHGDLAGNVWEWCSSLYWPYPYHAGDGREGPGEDTDLSMMHGGCWRSRRVSVRCAARQGEPSTDSFEVVGFRLARDA